MENYYVMKGILQFITLVLTYSPPNQPDSDNCLPVQYLWIEQAAQLQKEIEKEAHRQLREEKKADYKQRM